MPSARRVKSEYLDAPGNHRVGSARQLLDRLDTGFCAPAATGRWEEEGGSGSVVTHRYRPGHARVCLRLDIRVSEGIPQVRGISHSVDDRRPAGCGAGVDGYATS